jgi:copper chaperone CopZ
MQIILGRLLAPAVLCGSVLSNLNSAVNGFHVGSCSFFTLPAQKNFSSFRDGPHPVMSSMGKKSQTRIRGKLGCPHSVLQYPRGGSISNILVLSSQILRGPEATGDDDDTNIYDASNAAAAVGRFSKISSQYYLLSTTTIWKQIFFSTAALFIIRIATSRFLPEAIIMKLPCHSSNYMSLFKMSFNNSFAKFGSYLLPLLSSSCCAIQILLNVLAGGVGCVGFNSVLGPLRPYFISLLIVTSASSSRTFASLALNWCIALMPEIVYLVNQKQVFTQNQTSGDSSQPLDHLGYEATIHLKIKDMGCAACVNKINESMRRLDKNNGDKYIKRAESWLNDEEKGGRARLVVAISNEDEIDILVKDAVQIVERAGFHCTLERVEKIAINRK